VLLALGYQLHFSINSGPFYLRFAKPADLQWLMPVFWIGFNIALFPASVVTKRRGGLIVMGVAGLLGALAIVTMLFAPKGIWGYVAQRYGVALFPVRRILVRSRE